MADKNAPASPAIQTKSFAQSKALRRIAITSGSVAGLCLVILFLILLFSSSDSADKKDGQTVNPPVQPAEEKQEVTKIIKIPLKAGEWTDFNCIDHHLTGYSCGWKLQWFFPKGELNIFFKDGYKTKVTNDAENVEFGRRHAQMSFLCDEDGRVDITLVFRKLR
ncbi:MAG: hypothetical protein AAB885_01250 [Patescibacteria group bacterium]